MLKNTLNFTTTQDVEIDLEGVTINKDEELTWTGKSRTKE